MKTTPVQELKEPNRPLTSFFIFRKQVFDKVKEENPLFKMGKIAALIGKMWRELDIQKKMKYQEEFKKSQEEYQKECKEVAQKRQEVEKVAEKQSKKKTTTKKTKADPRVERQTRSNTKPRAINRRK